MPTPTAHPLRRASSRPSPSSLVATASASPDQRRRRAGRPRAGSRPTPGPSSAPVAAGRRVTSRVDVTAATSRQALVDVEVYDAAGRKVYQRPGTPGRSTAGAAADVQRRRGPSRRTRPSARTASRSACSAPAGAQLLHWNDQAAAVDVVVDRRADHHDGPPDRPRRAADHDDDRRRRPPRPTTTDDDRDDRRPRPHDHDRAADRRAAPTGALRDAARRGRRCRSDASPRRGSARPPRSEPPNDGVQPRPAARHARRRPTDLYAG